MPFQLNSLSDLADAGFDDVIDARSPSEFAEDRLPGSISLPVLSDEERARVGTHYVQISAFGARKIGAALVLRNIATHIETELADREGGWRPLVYCWRGGQRSGTFGWLLREIGWRAETLSGGYQTYRRLIVRDLYEQPLPFRFVVLDGMTCTAKTRILLAMQGQGAQVLDLEGLANHRGSVFGDVDGGQPGQKAFESRIANALARLKPDRPVLVEAESSKVGNLLVPPQVWRAMGQAPRIRVEAPLEARAQYFPAAYPDLISDPVEFSDRIALLTRLQGAARVAAWQAQVGEGNFVDVARDLMAEHYDPRYRKSASRHGPPASVLSLESLSDDAIETALPSLLDKVEAAFRAV